MNRKYKQSEIINKVDKITKDRGDLKKPFVDSSVSDKPDIPDCGDSIRKKPDIKDGYKRKTACKVIGLKNIEKESPQDLYDNMHLTDKYTVGLKSNQNSADDKIVNKTLKQLKGEVKSAVASPIEASNKCTKTDSKPDNNLVIRKPVIKTVISKKNTSEVLKVVNFITKKSFPAQLEVNLQTEHSNKVSKSTNTNVTKTKTKTTNSRTSVKVKPDIRAPVIRKKSGGRRRKRPNVMTSPEPSAVKNSLSPVTEVAKWAPSSLTQYTKPYYEAWVDTTLAAVPKDQNDDALFLGNHNIVKNFRRTLEKRDDSPELVYTDFCDEKFTGRIKVRRRYVLVVSFRII